MKSKLKRSGGKRRAAGWTLFALGLVVAGVWLWSGWWTVSVEGTTRACGVFRGVFLAGVMEGKNAAVREGVHVERAEGDESMWEWTRGAAGDDVQTRFIGVGVVWYEEWDFSKLGIRGMAGKSKIVGMALWPVPVLLWAGGLVLLHSGFVARRRAMVGKCVACGYDLAGLAVGAACPECGKGGTGGRV